MRRRSNPLAAFSIGFLVAAVLVMGIRAASVRPTVIRHTHYHANFLVTIDGAPVDFSAVKYMAPISACSVTMNQTPTDRVHMHESIGDVVHVHADGVTWGDFFTNIGYSLGANYVANDSGQVIQSLATRPVRYILNGVAIPNPSGLIIGDKDRLLVVVGSETNAGLLAYFNKVANTAAAVDAAKDPLSCAGSEDTTLRPSAKDRLKAAEFWRY